MNQLVSLPESARRLGLHPQTLKRRILRGELHGMKVLGRWRIPEAELLRLIEEYAR